MIIVIVASCIYAYSGKIALLQLERLEISMLPFSWDVASEFGPIIKYTTRSLLTLIVISYSVTNWKLIQDIIYTVRSEWPRAREASRRIRYNHVLYTVHLIRWHLHPEKNYYYKIVYTFINVCKDNFTSGMLFWVHMHHQCLTGSKVQHNSI